MTSTAYGSLNPSLSAAARFFAPLIRIVNTCCAEVLLPTLAHSCRTAGCAKFSTGRSYVKGHLGIHLEMSACFTNAIPGIAATSIFGRNGTFTARDKSHFGVAPRMPTVTPPTIGNRGMSGCARVRITHLICTSLSTVSKRQNGSGFNPARTEPCASPAMTMLHSKMSSPCPSLKTRTACSVGGMAPKFALSFVHAIPGSIVGRTLTFMEFTSRLTIPFAYGQMVSANSFAKSTRDHDGSTAHIGMPPMEDKIGCTTEVMCLSLLSLRWFSCPSSRVMCTCSISVDGRRSPRSFPTFHWNDERT
mmetsp:Transcript_12556/g.45150  ORF Transcript_12556/g.45150 Transcript_12556/m.45150 type:complete len:304 (-) Transcript_12556:2017-2928(-)